MQDKETYNNGKDLMPEDIFVEERKDHYGLPIFNAYLAVVPFESTPLVEGTKKVAENPSCTLSSKPKFYFAQGRTKKEAKNNLLSLLQEHLERLKS